MDVFDLTAKIALDTSEYNQGLDNASGKSSSFASKLKSGLKTAAKVGVAAITAASTAIGVLTKQSIENYAEYEQLVGGVETLFKDSAGKVQEYAANAYKTAGMSANDYMETVTSFSGSLLQSLGGDTERAASVADRAITDMSDNANKMGTSMESIQYAYQGFAKQNYTMLDNLKLGYGGTKEEMERLLSDAEKLPDALGRDFDISNYADIVEAIHLVQKEMGISGITAEEAAEAVASGAMTQEEAFASMGTTAKEAATTIQGSVASAKSAWKNLVTSLGDENANVSANMETFVDTVVTAAGNIVPRIGIILQNIGPLIAGLAPIIAGQLPGLIETLVPSVIQAAASLVGALVQNLPEILSSLFTAISNVVDSMIGGLGEQFPFLASLLNTLKEVIPIVVGAFVAYEAITKTVAIAQGLLNAVMNANPFVLVISLVAALVVGLKTLWETNEGFREAVIRIWETIKGVFIGAWDSIKAVWNTVSAYFSGIWNAIKGVFSVVASTLGGFFSSAWNNIKNAWSSVTSFFSGIWNSIKSVFSGAGSSFASIGRNVVNGLKNGISNAWGALTSWVKSKFSSLVSGVKSLLGIASPSKAFAGIGGYMAEGVGVGWDKAYGDVKKLIDDDMDFSGNVSVSGTGNPGYQPIGPSLSGATFNINVNGANIQNDQELAERIAFEMQRIFDRKAAVFGT